MSSVPPPASAMSKSCFDGFYNIRAISILDTTCHREKNDQLTETTFETNPLNTHACKLASPSWRTKSWPFPYHHQAVNHHTLLQPSCLSAVAPPIRSDGLAQIRCHAPQMWRGIVRWHGCRRWRSGCNRIRKSSKTVRLGRGEMRMPFMFNCIVRGRRWSLKLTEKQGIKYCRIGGFEPYSPAFSNPHPQLGLGKKCFPLLHQQPQSEEKNRCHIPFFPHLT